MKGTLKNIFPKSRKTVLSVFWKLNEKWMTRMNVLRGWCKTYRSHFDCVVLVGKNWLISMFGHRSYFIPGPWWPAAAAVYSARPRVAARGPDGSNGGAGQRWRHPGPWNRAANKASRSFHSAPTSTAFSQLCLTMLNRHVNSVSKCEIGMLVSKDHSQQAVWLASLKQLVVAFNQEKVLIVVGAFSGRCETSRRFVDSSRRHPGPWTRVIRSSLVLVTTDRCTPLQLHWGE